MSIQYESSYNKIYLRDFEKSLLNLSSSVRIGSYKDMRFARLDCLKAYWDSDGNLQTPSYLLYAYVKESNNTPMLTTDTPVQFYEALREQATQYERKKIDEKRKILENKVVHANAELSAFIEGNALT